MISPRMLEGHNPGTLSLSRTLFALSFAFAIIVGCMAIPDVFFHKLGLPDGAGDIFGHATQIMLICGGGYVGREGTKRIGRNRRRRRIEEGE